jgi:hypothetical protein
VNSAALRLVRLLFVALLVVLFALGGGSDRVHADPPENPPTPPNFFELPAIDSPMVGLSSRTSAADVVVGDEPISLACQWGVCPKLCVSGVA